MKQRRERLEQQGKPMVRIKPFRLAEDERLETAEISESAVQQRGHVHLGGHKEETIGEEGTPNRQIILKQDWRKAFHVIAPEIWLGPLRSQNGLPLSEIG